MTSRFAPWRWVVLGLIVALAVGSVVVRPDRAIRVASALVSQTLCSAEFVSGLDAESVYAGAVRPMGYLRVLSPVLRFHVDHSVRSVETRVAGLFRSRAVYRDEAGCLLAHGEPTPPFRAEGRPAVAAHRAQIVQPANDRIRAILERAFTRGDLATTAVVIVHADSVIAERYAPDYGVDTRLQGWSLKKSVVNALIGILVRDGSLRVDSRAPVASWDRETDQRRAITIDHLLRMTSGLALSETNSGFDPVSRMLFLERDQAAFATRAQLDATPGTRWQYSTGNTVLLGRIIRDAVGGSAEAVARFARKDLFAPLGMSTALLEYDATGVPIAMYASARDWARFGQLFASDGVVHGRRILPERWVAYSTMPTLGLGYGAGWWLGGPQWRPDWKLPADAFYAAGHLHQKILIIPSAQLVIARFGVTHLADDGLGIIAAEVLAALADSNRLPQRRAR